VNNNNDDEIDDEAYDKRDKIPWHSEVLAGAVIKKEHDIHLLEKSFDFK
jgi:hypothetical protein